MCFFWQNFTKWQILRGLFNTPLLLKGLDASGLPNFKPHDLWLAAILMTPSTKIVKGSILSILVQSKVFSSFMDVVMQLLHIHCHHLTFSIFLKLCSCLSPTSHLSILPSSYVLLLWFIGFVLCNKQRRFLPLHELWLGNASIIVCGGKHGKEWHEDFCLHGMGVECFGSRFKMELKNNHKYFLLFPNLQGSYKDA